MRKTTRQILFFFFAGAFLVSAPLVVLYTAGYRLSFNNYRVLETGALATNTSPRNASVLVDNKKDSSKTPTVVQNVLPHDTHVQFEKPGYISWEQTVPVIAGRTTYVSAVLYADAASERLTTFGNGALIARSPDGRYLLILDPTVNGMTVTLYDDLTRFAKHLGSLPAATTAYAIHHERSGNIFVISENDTPVVGYTVSGERVEGAAIARPGSDSPVTLVNNGKNVEVWPTRSSSPIPGITLTEKPILAILPQGTYSVAAFDDEFVVLKDERRVLTVVSLSGGNAITLGSPASILDWLPDLHLLTWSDGIEVNSYDAATGEKTFFTRQSDLITTLTWHPSGSAVFVGTTQHITAVDREAYNNRVSTLLLDSEDPILDMWLDKSGKTLYILKDIKGSPALERRKLVQ